MFEFHLILAITSLVSIVIFCAAGIAISWADCRTPKFTFDYFLTARKQHAFHIAAWSFYSATIGAWVLIAPVRFADDPLTGTGYVGLISYAFFSGFPVMAFAAMGGHIRTHVSNVRTLGCYARWRFGSVAQLFVTCVVILNTAVGLIAEYSVISGIFELVLNMPGWVGVIGIGCSSMLFIVFGGLPGTIKLVQWQSICALLCLSAAAIYMTILYKDILLPPLPLYLDATPAGYKSIFSLGIALTSSTFFSDAIWQRMWACDSIESVYSGGFLGGLMTFVVVGFFGFGGILSYWVGGNALPIDGNPNNAFLSVLNGPQGQANVVVVICVMIFVILTSQASVASMQNGITSTVTTLFDHYGTRFTIIVTRVMVVVVNLPIMFITFANYDIVSLFLVPSMINACCFFPFLAGVMTPFHGLISELSVLFACGFSILSVAVFGFIVIGNSSGFGYFIYRCYDWRAFMVAVVASLIGLALCALIEIGVRTALGYKKIRCPKLVSVKNVTKVNVTKVNVGLRR